eukprot:gene20003-21964_t
MKYEEGPVLFSRCRQRVCCSTFTINESYGQTSELPSSPTMAFGNFNFAVFLAFIYTAQCLIVNVRDCGSNLGKYGQVEITPCNEQPCPLIRGKNVTIDVHFTPTVAIDKADAKLYGVIAGIPVPFPIPHSHVCDYAPSKVKCPLKAGVEQVYELELPVSKEYPEMKLEAKLSLIDEKSTKTIFCVEMPVHITDGVVMV